MRIDVTGIAPLMMHNVLLADDQQPIVKAIKKLTAKRTNKTEDDKHEIDRLSFVGGLYYDDTLGPYMPAENVFRCLMEAGTLTKSGKKIERGLTIHTLKAPLQYEGPRDPEKLWDDGTTAWVDRRMVTVTRQRIPRIRPIFPEWEFSMHVDIDKSVLDMESFVDILEKAGKLIGLGDYRRFYGKFTAEVAE